MNFAKLFAMGAAAALLAVSAQAADITAGNSGWITQTGRTNTSDFTSGINNTFAGYEGEMFADWFSFELGSDAITSAAINIFNSGFNSTTDPDAVYSLYGATDFSYAGLTSGPVFGTVTLGAANTGADHFVTISLNSDGLAFLNSHLGGTAILSGVTTSAVVDPADCFDCVAIFGYTTGEPPAYLSLESGGGAVPEPAAWALMIGGFGLAGATLRRRRAVAA